MFTPKLYENGDVEAEGWRRVTPDGCPACVLTDDKDTFIVIMCQRLEPGEMWRATILECPHEGGPHQLQGGLVEERGSSGDMIFDGLAEQVSAFLK